MAKNKKRKPKQGKKFRPNLATVVRQVPKISYRRVTCKYLADSDNLTPVPSGQYWRCLDCNAKVRKVGDVDAWGD